MKTVLVGAIAAMLAIGSILQPPPPPSPTIPDLPIDQVRSPWNGHQGKFRNTSRDLDRLPPIQLAASNTIGPRGGGEVYLYLF